MPESDLYGPMLRAASQAGSRLFRNHVGMATHVDEHTGARRKVRTGLAPGSSDLIGWTPVLITPEMVGRTLAVFTSIEAKTAAWRSTPSWRDSDQAKWLAAVLRAGAIAGVARSVEEELVILAAAKNLGGPLAMPEGLS